MDFLFGRSGAPYSKVVIVVDEDVDISDPREIAWALGSRVRPDKDVIIKHDLPGLVIDPSAQRVRSIEETSVLHLTTSKLGIDATKPLQELDKYEKIDILPAARQRIARLIEEAIRSGD
jgi:UbiD family decarboxylase